MKGNTKYLFSERNIVFALLLLNSGILGAFAYIRTGVFCNAQTANLLMMGIEFGKGHWIEGAYYLIPFAAYLSGALVSELLTLKLTKTGLFRWNTYLIFIEIIALLGIGFVPLPSVPDNSFSVRAVQVSINFIASMQFTAFKRAQGIPMATTFCTNHIRQMGISIANAIHERKLAPLKRFALHFGLILCFFAGAVVCTLTVGYIGEMSIWLSIVPLLVILGLLMYDDINKAKQDKMLKAQLETEQTEVAIEQPTAQDQPSDNSNAQ